MMTRHIADRDLSAYLDGEARRPDRIAGHLERCAACAERYRKLAALSARVKAQPVPEVHPAFTARVLKAAGEAPRPAHAWGWRAIPLTAAALVLLFVIAAALFLRPAGPPAPEQALDRPRAIAEQVDVDALIAEIERRIAAGEEVDLADAVGLMAVKDPVVLGAGEDPFAVLAQAADSRDYEIRPYENTGPALDFDEQILLLDNAERQVFHRLLLAYAAEG